MRYLILSDIHGNIDALRAILRSVGPYDRLLCLGDLLGYGAAPNPVVDLVRKLRPHAMVRGNHDKVCTGLESGDNFNNNALQSAVWTQSQLSRRNRVYVAALPQGPLEVDPYVTICHGSPMDEDYYILYEYEALLSFQCFSTALCFYGHSHAPGVFVREEGLSSFHFFIPRGEARFWLDFSGDRRYLINPGSVGQPRDGDPRASCCLLDTQTGVLEFVRVPYPVRRAASRIQRAGLPRFLADRLLEGN